MRITWWGHATSTVQLGGVRVLTDPVLTERVAHLVRSFGPVPSFEVLDADVVVISHLHADHLHVPSLRRLAARTRIVAPRGAAALLSGVLQQRIEEVEPGETVHVGAVDITATAADHDGRRLPGSRFRGPALGFVVGTSDERVWFAGDTGLFDAMGDVGPVDAAIVPVGGWGPTLGPHHLDPAQAAEAVRRVGARDAVPVHYGTLWPLGLRALAPALYQRRCREPGSRFAEALAGSSVRAHVIEPGSSVELDSP